MPAPTCTRVDDRQARHAWRSGALRRDPPAAVRLLARRDRTTTSTPPRSPRSRRSRPSRASPPTGVAAKPTLQQMGIWTDPTVPAGRDLPDLHDRHASASCGDPARCVETRLRQLGYWLSGPDATFDATAVTALKAFQTRYGLLADGIAGTSHVAGARHLGRAAGATRRSACTTGWDGLPRRRRLPGPLRRDPPASVRLLAAGPRRPLRLPPPSRALRRVPEPPGSAVTGIADYATLLRLGIWTGQPVPGGHVQGALSRFASIERRERSLRRAAPARSSALARRPPT